MCLGTVKAIVREVCLCSLLYLQLGQQSQGFLKPFVPDSCSRLLPSAGPLGILLLTRYSLCISFGHHAKDNVFSSIYYLIKKLCPTLTQWRQPHCFVKGKSAWQLSRGPLWGHQSQTGGSCPRSWMHCCEGTAVCRLGLVFFMSKWPRVFHCGWNRPFPSSLVPLFQNESKCGTILMKMTLICMKMKLRAELIFIWKVSHLDSFWNRGTRELGNGLLKMFLLRSKLNCHWFRTKRSQFFKRKADWSNLHVSNF